MIRNILSSYIEAASLSQSAVGIVDETGKFVYYNTSFAEMHKLKEFNPSYPISAFQINPHFNYKSWKEGWQNLIEKRQVSRESEHMTGDGEMFPVKVNAVILSTKEGFFNAIVVENLLVNKQTSDLLDIILETRGVVGWEYNNISHQWSFTSNFEDVFGFTIPEPAKYTSVTRKFIKELPVSVFRALAGHMRKVFKEQQNDVFEFELNSIHYRIHSRVMVFEGSISKVYGVIENIQEELEKQAPLLASHELIDTSSDLQFSVKQNGKIKFFNPVVKELLPDIELGENIFNFVTPEILIPPSAQLADWAESKSVEVLLRGGKSTIFLALSVSYKERGDHRYYFLRGIEIKESARDILRYKLSTTALNRSFGLVLWTDLDGALIYANSATRELLNISEDALPNLFIEDINPSWNQKNWQNLITRLQEVEEEEFEVSFLALDDHTTPVRLRSFLAEENDQKMVCFIGENLDRPAHEAQLFAITKDAVKYSPNLMAWLNEQGVIEYANRPFKNTFALPGQDLGNSSRDLKFMYPELTEHFEEIWHQANENSRVDVEFKHELPDGTHRWYRGNFSPVDTSDVPLVFLYLHDITDQKEAENELREAFQKISALREKLSEQNYLLKEEIDTHINFESIISVSPKYHNILSMVTKVAPTDASVLVTGETGTGKELLARAIHQYSPRKEEAFIKVNCAALPENLIESELFGHEKGAFTGAHERKIGKFEAANEGTIFLDEIGELPLALQSKLLRVLQEGEFERVGSTKTIGIDVRIIAATNRDLAGMTKKQKFRKDLYYRLNVFPIHNLPLRDRREDIMPLVKFFIEKYAKRIGKSITKIPRSTETALLNYNYPGNIRELENIVERSIITSPGDQLIVQQNQLGVSVSNSEDQSLVLSLEEATRQHIIQALELTNWRVSGNEGAARLLDIPDKTLFSKMKKLNIKRPKPIML